MKILNLPSCLAMLTLALLFTACSKDSSTVDSVQTPDLNTLAAQINASPEYKAVQEIRVAIFEELGNFYTENKKEIAADPTVLENFLSSRTDTNNGLQKATAQLKKQFTVLNSLTEEEVISVFEIADNTLLPEIQMSTSCWDFCHNQYLSCDSACYARYLRFPDYTFADYLACNQNCVLFVFYTCLDYC